MNRRELKQTLADHPDAVFSVSSWAYLPLTTESENVRPRNYRVEYATVTAADNRIAWRITNAWSYAGDPLATTTNPTLDSRSLLDKIADDPADFTAWITGQIAQLEARAQAEKAAREQIDQLAAALIDAGWGSVLAGHNHAELWLKPGTPEAAALTAGPARIALALARLAEQEQHTT